MTTRLRLLQIDSSARTGRYGATSRGSHTRALTHRFITRWLETRPQDEVIYRDIGTEPPTPVSSAWVQAAFATPQRQEPWMPDTLAESDRLVAELRSADVIVIGAPLYNFGMPSALKAWVDNIVRVGLTFAFEPEASPEDPYVPLLSDRQRVAIVLSSRGAHGMEPGGEFAHMNHLEPHLRTALSFIGIEELHQVAVEHQEDGGDLLAASVAAAHASVDALVRELQRRTTSGTVAAVDSGTPAARSSAG
jgi:FMN-dependent NADH-azoreductase